MKFVMKVGFYLTFFRLLASFAFAAFGTALTRTGPSSGLAAQTGGAVIELPPIETALARKQLWIDFGSTGSTLKKYARRAFILHGGYKEVPVSQGHYTFEFRSEGSNRTGLRILTGKPRRMVFSKSFSGSDQLLSMLRACDAAVVQTLRIPGFFSGRLAFLSDQTKSKEIYTGNALLTSAMPKTNFKKITYNASWSADGRGIFFTSNRHVFNNVFYLNLGDNRISTIAKYKGNNLRAAQNPLTGQVALILSSSGNPELWLADRANARPKRVTRNKSNESGPCWSPDGRRLIVTSDARGKPQLYEVKLASGALSKIPTNVSSHCTEASWNPRDSSKVAFTAAVGGGFQVCLFDFGTRKSRILTQGTSHSIQPCWVNDGRHLIFTQRSRGGAQRLMIIDTEGEGAKPEAMHGKSFGNCSQASFFYPRS